MIAYDNAYPTNQATSDVTIAIIRDQFGPVFQPNSVYEITISEKSAIGGNVIQVNAVDPDNVSWPR